MADHIVYLLGGPCDGDQKTLTQKQYDSHHTSCKGVRYTYNAAFSKGFEFPVFAAPGASANPGASSGPQTTVTQTSVYKAWGDIRNSVNHQMPTAVNAIAGSQRRLLQTLIHKRRVR